MATPINIREQLFWNKIMPQMSGIHCEKFIQFGKVVAEKSCHNEKDVAEK